MEPPRSVAPEEEIMGSPDMDDRIWFAAEKTMRVKESETESTNDGLKGVG